MVIDRQPIRDYCDGLLQVTMATKLIIPTTITILYKCKFRRNQLNRNIGNVLQDVVAITIRTRGSSRIENVYVILNML